MDMMNAMGEDGPALQAALSGKMIETPRTREALRRTGITMQELRLKGSAFNEFSNGP